MAMYNAVLPSYSSKKDESNKESEKKDAINADDPANKNKVHKILFDE